MLLTELGCLYNLYDGICFGIRSDKNVNIKEEKNLRKLYFVKKASVPRFAVIALGN